MGQKQFFKKLGTDGTIRLRFKIVTRNGKIIDFVVQLEVFVRHKWHPVVRYDFAHGFPHRDILSPNGNEEKKPLILDTMEQCVQYAEQDLMDRYEWYIEQFSKYLK